MKKIVLTGGGSAGHVIPNIALIPQLKKYFTIFYIGSGAIEKSVCEKHGVKFFQIDCPKLVRGKIAKNFLLPIKLAKSVKEAKKILKTLKPDVVFSKGGYVSFPVVYAAEKLGIRCFSHESDLSAGLANKLIAKKCEKVFTAFQETTKQFKNSKFVGAPIREELFYRTKQSAMKKLSLDETRKTLLFFGGGSGAKAINSVLEEALPMLEEYNILHIYGSSPLKIKTGKNYCGMSFCDDMASLYAACDLVVSRAGANSVFECMALKKRAIFIPLPKGVSRGDQEDNADYFFKKGSCRVILQENLTKDSLLKEIKSALCDKELEKNLDNLTVKSATDEIVQLIVNYSR